MARLEEVVRRAPGRNARAAWTERTSLLVTLEGGGVGEAAPLPGYSPDTLEECRAALIEPIRDWRALPPAARFAVEMALGLDLPGPRRPVARCRLVASAGDIQPADAFKVKIGVAGDRELCAAIRARFPSTPLRLDANGVRVALDGFARFDPELVEEPYGLEAPFPLALDESLQRLEPDRLPPGIAALALKPMALGGAARCLAFARAAAARGLAVYASHLHDGPIARAATLALAEALPGKVLACGI